MLILNKRGMIYVMFWWFHEMIYHFDWDPGRYKEKLEDCNNFLWDFFKKKKKSSGMNDWKNMWFYSSSMRFD